MSSSLTEDSAFEINVCDDGDMEFSCVKSEIDHKQKDHGSNLDFRHKAFHSQNCFELASVKATNNTVDYLKTSHEQLEGKKCHSNARLRYANDRNRL